MENKKKKTKKWIKPRHMVIISILRPFFHLYVKLRYRIKIEKYKGDKKQPLFILFNHQTAFDQFFVSLAFPRHIYYISSEDLFSKKWISRLLSYAVAPIPFRKSTSDISAIKNCMRIMREGGSIGMAPEGNRTYSGTTEYMKSGVASMAKALKMPLAFFRIEGGYGTHPRWSDDIRKGRMRGYFSRIIPYEEVKAMSDDELFELIKRELYVDEREDQTLFKSKRPAEFLDRAMYYCPQCKLSTFYSERDIIACTKCGRAVRYLENKRLSGVGFDFEFDNVKDWYDAQSDFVRALDLSPYENTPVYEEEVALFENIYCKRKILIDKHAKIRIFSDRLAVSTENEEFVFSFKDVVAATVLGKNKLNFYVGSKIYQFKGDKHFNALKYLNLYYHATETRVKENEPQFLGL